MASTSNTNWTCSWLRLWTIGENSVVCMKEDIKTLCRVLASGIDLLGRAVFTLRLVDGRAHLTWAGRTISLERNYVKNLVDGDWHRLR